MQLRSFAAASALLVGSLAAHADSINQQLTIVDGNAGATRINTNSFNDFNPQLGTLTSVVAFFQGVGTATGNYNFFGFFTYLNHSLDIQNNNDGISTVPGPFYFSGSLIDTNASQLSLFTGSGVNPFMLEFGQPTTNVTVLGSVTYNYTAAATPEPSSFALLGTGLLGIAGVLRKRFA